MNDANRIDDKKDSPGGGAGFASVAWASVGLGVASWCLAGSIPVGLDVAAIVLGLIALRGAPAGAKRMRRVAGAGVAIGGAKLLAVVAMLVWLFVAFSLNPVAH